MENKIGLKKKTLNKEYTFNSLLSSPSVSALVSIDGFYLHSHDGKGFSFY